MMGGGAAGLGALAMLPSVSAFSINSDQPLSFNNPNQSGTEFEVGPSGDITSMGSFATGSPVPFQDQIQPQADIKDNNDTTVYDHSKKQVGDGTTQAQHQSINTERSFTNSRNADVVIQKVDGAIKVDGPTGNISFSGDVCDAIEAVDTESGNAGVAWHLHIASETYSITGTFSEGEQATIDNLGKISGGGYGTHLRVDNGTTNDGEGIEIFQINTPIEICDLRVDGNWQNNTPIGNSGATDGHNFRVTAPDVLFDTVWSVRSTGDGIEWMGAAVDCRAENVILKDNWEQNLHYHGCTNVDVQGICKQEQNNGNISTWCNDGQVTEDCSFTGVVVAGQKSGVQIEPGSGAVRGFTFRGLVKNVSGPGVWIRYDDSLANAPDAVPEDIHIDAEIKGCVGSGVDDETGGHAVYIDRCKNVTLAGDYHDNGRQGVLIDRPGAPAEDLTITADIHHNDGHAIWGRVGSAAIANGLHVTPEAQIRENGQDAPNLQADGIRLEAGDYNPSDLIIEPSRIVAKETGSEMTRCVSFWSGTGSFSDLRIRNFYHEGESGATIYDETLASEIHGLRPAFPMDVRQLDGTEGNKGWHDGTNSNTVGPAQYINGAWSSLVDGSTIS